MKRYKLFSVLATAAAFTFSMSSCYDLDTAPADKLSSASFYKNKEHADQAMMGIYSVMHLDHVYGIQFGLDCLGGIGMGYDNPSFQTFARDLHTPTTGYVSNKWSQLYEGVARCNSFLQNVDKTDMSEELKAQYKAEARFMRGLFYWNLLKFFGGIPLYDETTNVSAEFSNMMKPRESEENIRKFILDDLDVAISLLPDAASYEGGRATKWAAVALKGKILLFNKQYTEAATCFESVINSGKFELYESYENLFKPGGDESNEIIFAVQNMGGVGTDFGMPLAFYMGTRTTYGGCWNNVMASTDFVDSYECKDGKKFNWNDVIPNYNEDNKIKEKTFIATLKDSDLESYPEAKDKLLEMYANRDPRMSISIILPYTKYLGWYQNAEYETEYVIASVGITDGHKMIRNNKTEFRNYLWRKFVPEGNLKGQINNRADTPINFPLIRYADVLLMLAECYNESDDTRDDAIDLINDVRARVDMPAINNGDDWMAANTKDEVFQRIKHERAVELAAEGHSYDDMRRWGLLETLNGKQEKTILGAVMYTHKVGERSYLWPIPSTEIEKNPDLKQNPGW